MKRTRGRIVVAAIAFLSLCLSSLEGAGQTQQDAYCVFERVDAHSMFSHCISRIDWLSVARCREAANLAPRFRQPLDTPFMTMTYAEAAALADAIRLNFGAPPSGSDRFHNMCDRWHSVWIRPGTNPPQRAFTHQDTGAEHPGSGYALETSRVCCEDAAMMVDPGNPAPSGDCRAFNLLSVPGVRVARTASGWVSVSGSAVTITPPGRPPFTIPAATGRRLDDSIPGVYALKVTAVSAACGPDTSKMIGQTISRVIVTQSGNQVTFHTQGDPSAKNDVVAILNPDGSLRWSGNGGSLTGRFAGGELFVDLSIFAPNCVMSVVGTKER